MSECIHSATASASAAAAAAAAVVPLTVRAEIELIMVISTLGARRHSDAGERLRLGFVNERARPKIDSCIQRQRYKVQ